jgi:tetraacyldisaccharide 4'-kinase
VRSPPCSAADSRRCPNWFTERGVNAALLSRGYRSLATPGADASGSPANDEKLVLDRLCPGVPHLQQPDRVAGAKSAVKQHAAELLILDDGFQHRRLHRDLDVVLIDALNPFGYGRLLPRGLLREPLSGLKRADVILLTRADQCTGDEKRRVVDAVRQFAEDRPPIEVAFRPDGLIGNPRIGEPGTPAGNLPEAHPGRLSSLHGKPVAGFCGVGNPESFRRTIAGCDVRAFRAFPDHHHYTAADLRELAQLAATHGCEAVLTTLKDLVKIDAASLDGLPLRAVQIVPEFLTSPAALHDRLEQLRTAAARKSETRNSKQFPTRNDRTK